MKNKILAWSGAIILLALCLITVAYLDDHFELRDKLVGALAIGSCGLAKAFFDWIRRQAPVVLPADTANAGPTPDEIQAQLPNDPPQW